MSQKEIAEKLRSAGLKVTPQRLAILNIISSGGHFTGEQIYESIKKVEPGISLSTVYNTLETLTEYGILNAFEAKGVAWYEMKKDDHVNVVCIDTDQIIDIPVDVSGLIKSVTEEGMKIRGISLVAYAECSKREHLGETHETPDHQS